MRIPDDLFLDYGPPDCPPLTEEMVARAERRLGYKLPTSYLEVLRVRNGGMLHRRLFRRPAYDGQPAYDFGVFNLYGIGEPAGIDADEFNVNGEATGECLSEALIRGWNFPNVGVVISFGGHAGYLLDYSLCGPSGEPRIIWAHSERQPVEAFDVAPDFATFIEGLTEYNAGDAERRVSGLG